MFFKKYINNKIINVNISQDGHLRFKRDETIVLLCKRKGSQAMKC